MAHREWCREDLQWEGLDSGDGVYKRVQDRLVGGNASAKNCYLRMYIHEEGHRTLSSLLLDGGGVQAI